MPKDNIIRDKAYEFALTIIKLYQKMCDQNEYVIAKQLLRSGTSIGANVEEASAAQSRKDFISKMAIASKEARETNYWLRLIRDSDIGPGIDLSQIIDESEQIIRLLTAIVKTSKKKN